MARPKKEPSSHPNAGRDVRELPKDLESSGIKVADLGSLPIGARLLVRTKKDWKTAAVSRFVEDRAVLTICSSSGRTYRLYREVETSISYEGILPILRAEEIENWKDNFSSYDRRW